MDFVLVNPLLKAAKSLNKMVELGDIAPELEELMRGGADNKAGMTERWAGTAVELKSGEMVIVPVKDPVAFSEDEGWAVRIIEGGKFGGRSPRRTWRREEEGWDKAAAGRSVAPRPARHKGGGAIALYACARNREGG